MPYRLSGKIQHYAWGGSTFIPELLHIKNASGEPYAEYWLGAHQKAPSTLSANGKKDLPLDKFIQQNPEKYLGKETAKRFGRLPYLFKVLDVNEMLSIQVHPTKAEAEKGFARENAAGIPLDAPNRNYKDDNHKPEMMAALSEFYLLHGFREKESLRQILSNTPELKSLLTLFDENGYEALYSHVMSMPQSRVNEMLSPLLIRLLPLYEKNKLKKNTPGFWAAQALASGMTNLQKADRGILSIYFLNLVHLQPGEGTFQDAGTLHAYLEGQNIELMANSDNVLRGGLTAKHVDVKELLKHVHFEGGEPKILKAIPITKSEQNYPNPALDFSLNKIELKKGEVLESQSGSIEILLLIAGKIFFDTDEKNPFKKGESALLISQEKYNLKALENTLIYKASVPLK